MTFNVEYALEPDPEDEAGFSIGSDAANRSVYLMDDKGNRYDHERAGGCAAKEIQTVRSKLLCQGWFVFPPAQEGARSFDFHYSTVEDVMALENAVIKDIVLYRN